MTIQLTREKFQDIVNEIGGGPTKVGRGKKATYYDIEKFQENWISSGVTGGDCWGNEANRPIDPDPEPKAIENLDILLERVCPNISYIKYRRIESLIKYDEKDEPDYYGNRTVISSKSINIQRLWEYLTESGTVNTVPGDKNLTVYERRVKAISLKYRQILLKPNGVWFDSEIEFVKDVEKHQGFGGVFHPSEYIAKKLVEKWNLL